MELSEKSHIIAHDQLAENSQNSSHSSLTEMDQDHKSTKTMASFNYINSIIGSGIIGIPYAFKQAGFGLGIILVLVVTIVTDYSLLLLIHGGQLSSCNTYQDVMRASFGRTGFVTLTIMQFMYPFIAMISYNVILGDTVTKIVIRFGGEYVTGTIFERREFVILALTLMVTLPLCFYKNIAKMAKLSFVSISFVVIIICLVSARSVTMDVPATPEAWTFMDSGITSAIGIMAFAYMCHHNSFLIYDSLIEPSESSWGKVTHYSMVFSMICTIILGVTGYATFTGFTQGDILENYCKKDDLMNLGRFLFACTIMLTYPIECFVIREVVENAVFAFSQPPPAWRHVAVTVVVVVSCTVLSMTTDCLGFVLELNVSATNNEIAVIAVIAVITDGVLNAAPMAYIFPALCVLKLQQDRVLSWKNAPCIATATFGILVSVVGLGVAIVKIYGGITCSHGREMDYCLQNDNPLNNTSVLLDRHA